MAVVFKIQILAFTSKIAARTRRESSEALDTMADISGVAFEVPATVEMDRNETYENEDVRTKKRAKNATLHECYSVPLSFLEDAVSAAQKNDPLNLTNVGKPFGRYKEAYVRSCYEDIVQSIGEQLPTGKATQIVEDEMRMKLFIICGSSGIGKSTFLAYFLVRTRNYFGKTILCHAGKSARNVENENAICQVWEGGRKVLEGVFGKVKENLAEHMTTTTLIAMDGCSLPINLTGFRGTVIMAASPSLYVKNMQDSFIISNRKSFTMPALSEEEALAIAAIIGVTGDVVKTNFRYMNGITRYLFEQGNAKLKVEEAVLDVDSSAIMRMVSMRATTTAVENFMVHSLVLWKVDSYDEVPRFELVSRYAERLDAKKLAAETAAKLKEARQNLAPMSGAQGYAGALFEAYAIRTLQAGGSFVVRSLSGKASFSLQVPALGTPVVIETNTVSTATVPYNIIRIAAGQNSFAATLLWPTTTNFPTFDCFYFHTDGNAYPLQMTIATTQDLKNSGAYNAKVYFDGLFGPRTYPVVFVVPEEIAPTYQAQRFQGNVEKKPLDVTPYFDQWVMGV